MKRGKGRVNRIHMNDIFCYTWSRLESVIQTKTGKLKREKKNSDMTNVF